MPWKEPVCELFRETFRWSSGYLGTELRKRNLRHSLTRMAGTRGSGSIHASASGSGGGVICSPTVRYLVRRNVSCTDASSIVFPGLTVSSLEMLMFSV